MIFSLNSGFKDIGMALDSMKEICTVLISEM